MTTNTMYGFSGYGTNSYATRRLFSRVTAPFVKLRSTTVRMFATLMNVIQLRFRNTTLSDPQTNRTTLEL